jgi:hypothetical protein
MILELFVCDLLRLATPNKSRKAGADLTVLDPISNKNIREQRHMRKSGITPA